MKALKYGSCLVCGKYPGPAWEDYCQHCGAQQQAEDGRGERAAVISSRRRKRKGR